jgi:tetratricopeptide (TPR) repeat protein
MILISLILQYAPIDATYLESLYSRQDPWSLTKQLYFYSEYPDSKEGAKAKQRILDLLKIDSLDPLVPLNLNVSLFEDMLKAIFKTTSAPISLNQEAINFIKTIAKSHHHLSLKGHSYKTKEELIKADTSDIDVGRGMFLLAFGQDEEALKKIDAYEAVLDFMAVCIKARLKPTSTKEDVVHAMNHFIFYELGYRFPAYSEHEEKIDTYTILPSVLDNRQGVCLGVSLLYYSLAQRLGLDLDIYTPPGHIFLSLHEDLNIETTARGVHMPLERYLSLHIKELKKRNQKELLGMALFNQASVFLRKEDYKEAAKLYEQVLEFIPNDPQTLELLGSCYVMNHELKKANVAFSQLKTVQKQQLLSSNYVLEDFFKGLISPDGLRAVFKEVDPNMQSLIEKAKLLEKVHKKSPKFRSALYQLGVTYLQLHQYEKAFLCFKKLYPEASDDPVLAYYLTQLSLILFDRPHTFYYKGKLEEILNRLNYRPKAAQHLFEDIEDTWPSPLDANK